MATSIFISYSRHDEREARFLGQTLEKLGYRVWIDQAELRMGEDWWRGILHAIREHDVAILVVSRAWLESDACTAERNYVRAVHRHVLPVLGHGAEPDILPADLLPIQAGQISDIRRITDAVDRLAPRPLPDPLPPEPPMPIGWQVVAAAVDARDELDVDVQLTAVRFLLDKTRSPDPAKRQRARRLAAAFARRPDLAPPIREVLPRRANHLPVIGAVLGGLALTHLLWVSGAYVYLDSVLDRLVGVTRGTARGVLTVNFLLGAVGLVLCGVAVRSGTRNGRVGLALCLVAIVGGDPGRGAEGQMAVRVVTALPDGLHR